MTSELDIGPLTWVKGEIDLALERAGQALKAFDQNPDDDTQLKFAKTHLHQAHGALSIVGLDGLTQFTDAIEQLLAAVEKGSVEYAAEVGAAAEEALAAIRHYLDDLVAGGPNQPLRLYPQYSALAAARGGAEVAPSELFFPDLSLRPPRREGAGVPADQAEKIIRRARFAFQRGLLRWFKHDDAGLADMRAAIDTIDRTQSQPAARAFWWATLGFVDGLMQGGVAADGITRRLCARIDAQIRRLIGGSRTVAERLMRDVLYQVALSSRTSDQIECVRAAYRLGDLVPPAGAARPEGQPQMPALRPMRELLAGVKEDWNRFAAGTAIALPQFHDRATQLADQAQGAGQVDFSRLIASVGAVASMLRKDPLRQNETVALEVATALLLAENALDNFGGLGVEFAHQVDVMTGRLSALLRGETLASLEAPQLDEMSRRAQERLLMSQVAREVLTNLAQIEQSLDGFFRDPSRGAELNALGKPMKQVEGALAILGESRAVSVLRECEARVAAFAAPEYVPQEEDFEDVASKLSALGFFIEQLQHGPADLDAILSPIPAHGDGEEGEESVEAASIEAEIAHTSRQTRALVEAFKEAPQDESVRGELRQNLEAIREDASLVANAELEQRAEAALAALDSAPEAATAHFEEVVAQMAPPVAEPVAPSAETVRLAAASSEEIDAELLGIFIEESHEVLATTAENFERLRAQPHDREALTTIRRGFHTLKGSGRMVGLSELGETAWAVEQVLNRWLQGELDATAPLQGMIGRAHQLFVDWVAQLEAGGGTHRDSSALVEECTHLREGEEAAPAAPAPVPAAIALEPVAPAPVEQIVPAEEMPAGIRLGDVTLSPTLYDMYLQEARTHLATLDRELSGIHLPPTTEMIRGAHTLASISATVGIAPVHQLAHALEGALVRLAGAIAAPGEDQRPVIAGTVAALEEMIDAISLGRVPPGDEVLTDALLRLAPAIVQEEPAGVEQAFPEPVPASILEEPLDLGAVETIEAIEIPELEEPTLTLVESAAAPESAEPLATIVPAPVVEVAAPAPVPEAAHREPVHGEAHHDEAEGERRKLRLTDDLDPQLLPIFLEEANDLMREVGNELRAWRATPADSEPGQQLKRLLHTLKGSARMAGAMSVGEMVHGMESRIEQIDAMPTGLFLDELDGSFDRVHSMIEGLKGGHREEEQPAPSGRPHLTVVPAAHATVAAVPVTAPAEIDAEHAAAHALLRVRADLVDKLANEAGEMAIARSRIEGEMRVLKSSLLDLTENVIRLRNQLREIEIQAESQMQSRQALSSEQHQDFDPLEFDRFTRFQELTRMMAESVNDVTTVQHNLLKNLDQADAAVNAQARLNRELSQALMSVRMVPFNSIADRLYRVVRQSAKELDKRANLDIRGGQTELDRSVLEKMTGPLEHLLRNAIGHGLERPAQRAAAGKPEIGQITLTLTQSGNEVAIELSDDGTGLDFARIRAKGIEHGLVAADQAVSEHQLMQLIFQSGFSTAEELTELAGRGVGMDVVKNETAALGGRIEIQSEAGRGTTFRILLPLTLAVTQAVLVRAGNRTYAIPSPMVAQVQELRPEATEAVRREGSAEWLGQTYPYHFLPHLLGEPNAQPQPARRYWLLLLKAGQQRLALEVDALVGNQEIVVKNIGAQLSRVVGISGATVLGDGEVALILNPIALVGREVERLVATTVASPAPAKAESVAAVPTIMVVDDSLTVRKITGRLLAREGYHVLAAKDGVDALEQTLDIVPDVMLVDIEMPRMDGFDLTRNIRADARLKNVPIIMITSRIADKHRNYAKEIGVNHYLGKPYDEDELLRLIAGYVKQPTT